VTLAQTQTQFFRALQGEETDAETCFAGTPELPAAERVAIYTQMALARLVEALRSDFPQTAAAFGDEAFHRLAREFVRAHPSRHADLGLLGQEFAAFCPPEARGLAQLEWARAEVLVEADVQPLPPDELRARLDSRGFLAARLRLVSALRLLGATAVWRSGFEVQETVLPAAEAQALRLALGGTLPFASALLQSWALRGWVAALD
jgi:Putative DNA-binding domain